jgi:hypothetical protein
LNGWPIRRLPQNKSERRIDVFRGAIGAPF